MSGSTLFDDLNQPSLPLNGSTENWEIGNGDNALVAQIYREVMVLNFLLLIIRPSFCAESSSIVLYLSTLEWAETMVLTLKVGLATTSFFVHFSSSLFLQSSSSFSASPPAIKTELKQRLSEKYLGDLTLVKKSTPPCSLGSYANYFDFAFISAI